MAPPWRHTLGLRRVNQTHLDLYSGYRKKFDNPQGIDAVKLVFNDEEGPGDDYELTVYGVNSGTGEIFYNKSMTSLGFFGEKGHAPGMFSDPVGVTCDATGNVFVADRGNGRIVHLVNERNTVGYHCAFDARDSGMVLAEPSGVCLEADTLYIADTANNRIVITGIDNHFIRALEGEMLEAPFALDVMAEEDWNFYDSRFLVVTDLSGQHLRQLSLNGEPLATLRYGEISDGTGGFGFVATDYYSNVYVTDRVRGCIYKFDRYLRYLTRIGCSGGRNDLVEPRGITIYRRYGQVFVAEKEGAIYYFVGTDVENLSATVRSNGNRLHFQVRFLLTEQSRVTIRLETDDRDVVDTYLRDRFVDAGTYTRDFEIEAGRLPCAVAECNFVVRVLARPTYSSRHYHEVERTSPVRVR